MSGPLIEIEGLVARYGETTVLDGLDLRVERGEWYLFLGPNGAGKTTTIRILLGLQRPTAGRVVFDGRDVRRDAAHLRRNLGYLPERFAPYPFLTGREYLGFIGDMHGLPSSETRRRAGELLELLEFGAAADQPAARYSMGMTRKLGLAAALVPRPSLLVLDEPTGNLDARSASLVRVVLEGLAERGTTILMSTHLFGRAEQLCHRIGILHGGRLAVEATREDLAARAGDQSLEQLFLSVTGEVGGEQVERFLAGWQAR